ncbi:GH1 family beta-glucosidase [Candidatus Methylocalor cossyra]|uniref:Beta-glucosidase n=1 Tax=Candidatus Methylocalor cossyra TaxID=3108543 RepID=A0ABM9NLF7_9GAMM
MTDRTRFPAEFLWGAATSAYQIEGSPLADGAGVSNWHRFSHRPGTVAHGDTGDLACDHYRRWRDDLQWMRRLGLSAYRFSIAWHRLFPDGRSGPNPKGLDFYQRLVDALNQAGIEPFITLHHWDMPAALEDLGGWAHRDCPQRFADYAHCLFRALAGRVRLFATLNEPWVIVHEGYLQGGHPPGLRSPAKARLAAHHLLLGHGLAVAAFRADGQGRIGLVVNLEPKHPASDRPEDQAAASRLDAYMNRQFLDPLWFGAYPDELAEIFGPDQVEFPAADWRLIRQPVDFLGINYYSRAVVRADPAHPPFYAQALPPQGECTAMGWEVYPAGLETCLLWVKDRYPGVPLYVTENGAAFDDPPPSAGRVADPRRTDYFRTHLRALHRAMAQGAPVQGYFAWSLLDNFEWTYGYAKRFGLIHVDFATQTRTLKDSGRFYQQVIESQGAILDDPPGGG